MIKLLSKYLLLLSISLNLFFIGKSQDYSKYNTDTINQIDNANKKEGWWVFFFNETLKNIKKEGLYVNSWKQGVWRTYYSNGNIKSKITYKNSRPDGYAKIYYESGKISEEGIWKGIKWVGKYKFYHENGKIAYDWNFDNNGRRSGTQKYYHKNGKLRIIGDWQEGKENGVIKQYDEKGNLKSEKIFAEGEFNKETSKFYAKKRVSVDEIPDDTNATISKEHINKTTNKNKYEIFDGNGHHILYNAYNKIDREGKFSNGRLINGKRYYYNSDRKKIKTIIYENGRIKKAIRH